MKTWEEIDSQRHYDTCFLLGYATGALETIARMCAGEKCRRRNCPACAARAKLQEVRVQDEARTKAREEASAALRAALEAEIAVLAAAGKPVSP